MLFSIDCLLENAIKPSLNYLNLQVEQLDCFLAAVLLTGWDNPTQCNAFHISHEQHWDLWDHYLVHKPELASHIRGMASQHRFLDNPDIELNLNLGYATAIAAYLLIREAERNSMTHPSLVQMAELWQTISPAINIDVLTQHANVIADTKTSKVA